MVKQIKDVISVLSDTKIRSIFIIILVVIVIGATIGYVHLKNSSTAGIGGSAKLAGRPSIESIPTVGEPTREYAKLQEQQNVTLAKQALQNQTAFIPTTIRSTYLEEGITTVPQKKSPPLPGCSVEELQKAKLAGVTAEELRCKGCSLEALKAAGYTAGELRNAGYSAKELKDAGFTAADLKNAGFSAKELKDSGFTAQDLKNLGFSAAELKDAGFNAADLKNAGFTVAELKDLGFTAQDLKNAGITAQDLKDAGATADELALAGFTNEELKNAGYTDDANKHANETLKNHTANCNIDYLRKRREQGISSTELKNLYCDAKTLKDAGYTFDELNKAGYTAKQLNDAGYTPDQLKKLALSSNQLKNSGLSAKALKAAGFNAQALKANGLTAGELKNANFTAAELKDAGYNATDLKAAGSTATELKTAGYSVDELGKAGFTDGDLLRAGFSKNNLGPQQTEVKPVQAQKKPNLKDLKNSGYTIKELKAAGVTDEDLVGAGFSNEEIITTSASLSSPASVSSESDIQTQINQMRTGQTKQLTAQEYQAKVKQIQAQINSQATDLFSSWVPLPSQQFVLSSQGVAKNGIGNEEIGNEKSSGEKNGAAVPSRTIKAGTVMFAILDTGINSDEKSPIMATIVDGDLKGSKLLGDFDRADKRVIIKFNLLNKPDLNRSISINAVAIDPNTARTAMATDVDNHYMLKYGASFAASFMGGIGQAFQDSGNNVQIDTSTGENVNFNASTNIAKAAVIGLGQAGNKLANQLQPLAQTPPTVMVKSGSGIGILIMRDLSVPLS